VGRFSLGTRPRERLPRPFWVQYGLPKETLRLLQSQQTSLSAPVKQVLIGAEVLAGAVGETPTHGIDEVQAHNAAPELESPLSPDAAHVRLQVSDSSISILMSITLIDTLMELCHNAHKGF
jgi:hypothetical protein